jgi:hypothetical protein
MPWLEAVSTSHFFNVGARSIEATMPGPEATSSGKVRKKKKLRRKGASAAHRYKRHLTTRSVGSAIVVSQSSGKES